MRPTKPINVGGRADWRYTPATKTDVAATIRAARKRMQEQAELQQVKVRKIR